MSFPIHICPPVTPQLSVQMAAPTHTFARAVFHSELSHVTNSWRGKGSISSSKLHPNLPALSTVCQSFVHQSGLISSINIASSPLDLQASRGCSPDGYLSGQPSPTGDDISSRASCLTDAELRHSDMHVHTARSRRERRILTQAESDLQENT